MARLKLTLLGLMAQFLVSSGQATARECPLKCPKRYRMVCASNGKTYHNECLMKTDACHNGLNDVSVMHVGPCSRSKEGKPKEEQTSSPSPPGGALEDFAAGCDPNCIRLLAYVCGSDGVSYGNQCLLELADCRRVGGGAGGRVFVQHYGPCEADGSDEAEFHGGDVLGRGAIQSADVVPPDEEETEETSIHAKAEQSRTGEDESAADTQGGAGCNPKCHKIHRPVCGTDGETYPNRCILELTDCRREASSEKGRVSLRHSGQCVKDPAPGEPDGQGQDPQVPREGRQILGVEEGGKVVGEGNALDICPSNCPLFRRLVCGLDGITYNNFCLLRLADCRRIGAGEGGRVGGVAHPGACPKTKEEKEVEKGSQPFLKQPVSSPGPLTGGSASDDAAAGCDPNCTKIRAPVCGSDGVTYDNECIRRLANCRDRKIDGGAGISLDHQGQC